MLCLDFQPFSIVEDVGFIRLMKAIEPHYKLPSRKYMAETIIPSINNGIQKVVEKEMWHSRRKSTFQRKNTKMSYLYHVVALTLLYLLVLVALQFVLLFPSYKGERVDH